MLSINGYVYMSDHASEVLFRFGLMIYIISMIIKIFLRKNIEHNKLFYIDIGLCIGIIVSIIFMRLITLYA